MLSNKHIYQYKLIFPFLTLITFSCNSVKYVSDDSFLLDSNEIQIIEETIGNGNEVVNHSKVTVHYIGKLEDKTEFDNSYIL